MLHVVSGNLPRCAVGKYEKAHRVYSSKGVFVFEMIVLIALVETRTYIDINHHRDRYDINDIPT
jgi:hypothetical protein